MKKATSLLLLCFLAAFHPVFSQSGSIEWGAKNTTGPFSFARETIYGSDDNGYYGFNFSTIYNKVGMISRTTMGTAVPKPGGYIKAKILFLRFDQQFKMTGKKLRIELKDPVTKKRRGYVKLMSFQNKFIIISALFDSKANTNTLYAQFINSEGGFDGDAVKIDVEDVSKRSDISENGFELSQDSSKLLFFKQEKLDKKGKDARKFYFTLLDGDLKVIWTKDFDLEYTFEYSAYKYVVDNKDKLYVLIKMNTGRKIVASKADKKASDGAGHWSETRKTKYDSRFLIEIYNPDKDVVTEFDVNSKGKLKGKLITDIGLTVNSKQQMLISGFYSNTGSKINGCFIVKLEGETENILLEKTKEFNLEFFQGIRTEIEVEDVFTEETASTKKGKKAPEKPKKEKKKKEQDFMKNYELRKLVIASDGSMRIVAEQFDAWVERYTYYRDGKSYTDYIPHYEYLDILVINIDKAGEIGWTTRIPKYQHTTSDGGRYSSFIMMDGSKGLHFIYNDNLKNMDPANADKIYLMNGAPSKYNIPVLVTVDESGKIRKTEIEQTENEDLKPQKSSGKDVFKAINDPLKTAFAAASHKILTLDQFAFSGNNIIVKQESFGEYRFGILSLSGL